MRKNTEKLRKIHQYKYKQEYKIQSHDLVDESIKLL